MAGNEAGNSTQGPPSPPDPPSEELQRQAETPPQGIRPVGGRTMPGMPAAHAPRGRPRETADEEPGVMLPERKVEYAPPRPLPAARRSETESPDPTTIEVADGARTSPPGAIPAEAPDEARESSATLDTLPPRGRHAPPARMRMVVIGVVAGVALATGFAVLRSRTATVVTPGPSAVETARASAPPTPEAPPEETRGGSSALPTPEPPPPEPRVTELAELPSAAVTAEPEPAAARPARRTATSIARAPRPPTAPNDTEATTTPRTSPRPKATAGTIVRESPF